MLAAALAAALLPGTLIPAALAQPKRPFTLEDIWSKPTFRQATVPGFDWLRDGRYYAALDRTGSLMQYSVITGQPTATLVDGGALRVPGSRQYLDADGYSFNAWMIKPSNFDPAKKYPVLMNVYGGPSFGPSSTQTVPDNAGGGTDFGKFLWHKMLAEQGYLVVSVENRGTSGRGATFRKATYGQLGRLETIDQGEGAKCLATLPYVDKARIGIWGWSYGGYLTSRAMTKSAALFKMGIAVAPVTNWRYYDTVYTERFLKTPQLNPAGYANSPVQFAQHLTGKFLFIHGTGDDNVHFQNSIALVDALIKANKDFQTLYYPSRNHGISGGNTRLHLHRQMTEFVKANL